MLNGTSIRANPQVQEARMSVYVLLISFAGASAEDLPPPDLDSASLKGVRSPFVQACIGNSLYA